MKHTKTASIFDKPELSEKERSLLFLMPLIQTAWAHGAVAPREKQTIFNAAREDAIDERDEFNDTLDELLTYQPSREFFDVCLIIIEENFARLTVRERTHLRNKILSRCRAVAESAGEKSSMDLNHHISAEERLLLELYEQILN